MSVEFRNDLGMTVIECDECGVYDEEDGFDGRCDIKNHSKKLRELEWKITCKDGEWLHYCPECKNKIKV